MPIPTKFVMTGAVIAACAYDVLAIQAGGDKASISYWMSSFRDYPMVMIGVGWLLCHFWGVIEKAPPAGDETNAA